MVSKIYWYILSNATNWFCVCACVCVRVCSMHTCMNVSVHLGRSICVKGRGQPLLSFLRKHHCLFCFQTSSHQSGVCQVARLDGHWALGICLFLPCNPSGGIRNRCQNTYFVFLPYGFQDLGLGSCDCKMTYWLSHLPILIKSFVVFPVLRFCVC